MTKLTFENEHMTVSITIEDSDTVEVFHEFVDIMLRPLVLGVGWSPDTVKEYLGD